MINKSIKSRAVEAARHLVFPFALGCLAYINGVGITGLQGDSIATVYAGDISSALIGVTIALAINGFVEMVCAVNKAFN